MDDQRNNQGGGQGGGDSGFYNPNSGAGSRPPLPPRSGGNPPLNPSKFGTFSKPFEEASSAVGKRVGEVPDNLPFLKGANEIGEGQMSSGGSSFEFANDKLPSGGGGFSGGQFSPPSSPRGPAISKPSPVGAVNK